MALWLSGFEHLTNHPKAGGGSYVASGWKFVFHTVEGYSRDPRATAMNHSWPPHFWVSLPSHPYSPRRKLQIVPLDRSAFALSHPAGTVETNKAHAIQVEIEGFANQSHTWSQVDLDWLTDEVVRPACNAVGINTAVFLDCKRADEGIVLATKNSPIRLSSSDWINYNGLLGHQHVPVNDHWDPGGLDIQYISARLQGSSSGSITGDEWLDMAALDTIAQWEQDTRKQVVPRYIRKDGIDYLIQLTDAGLVKYRSPNPGTTALLRAAQLASTNAAIEYTSLTAEAKAAFDSIRTV